MEYDYIDIKVDDIDSVISELNKMAKDGWRVITQLTGSATAYGYRNVDHWQVPWDVILIGREVEEE